LVKTLLILKSKPGVSALAYHLRKSTLPSYAGQMTSVQKKKEKNSIQALSVTRYVTGSLFSTEISYVFLHFDKQRRSLSSFEELLIFSPLHMFIKRFDLNDEYKGITSLYGCILLVLHPPEACKATKNTLPSCWLNRVQN
jgi:hypothetical protein